MNLRDKKGQSLVGLVMFPVLALIFVILMASFLYVFGIVDTSLTTPDITTSGGFNISNSSEQTFGKVNSAFLNSADLIGILFIFAVILALFMSGYVMRETTPVLFFVIDFLILLFAYILAVYVSNGYETILTGLPFQSLVVGSLGTTSTLMLYLPRIVMIAGVITMLITYAGIPKSQQEEIAGF